MEQRSAICAQTKRPHNFLFSCIVRKEGREKKKKKKERKNLNKWDIHTAIRKKRKRKKETQ
jgi:hypothetical protein